MIVSPEPNCLSDIIRTQAKKNPDSLAFLDTGNRFINYGQLDYLKDRVIGTLNEIGVGRQDRVAIVLPNGPELALAFLTITAGATSAPLNPDYSKSEFEFYLSDLEAKALVVLSGNDSPARQVAKEKGIIIIDLAPEMGGAIDFDLTGEGSSTTRLPGYALSDDIALVLHTSGTTSRPKMVPLTHANICSSARHICTTLELNASDRCLNVMPLFHIHGLMAIVVSSIYAGASVACLPGFNPDRFFEGMQAYRPTWYSAVPTIHQAVLARAEHYHNVIQENPLRLVRSSSASLPARVMGDLESVFSAPVIEAYGMTEAAHQMASNPLPPHNRKPGSVGIPAGPEIAVVNQQGEILSNGETGEIVIRGPNVMNGYINNPNANKSAFINGWFRTGDEGRFDPEGYLYITGRLKEMINRGGEKVVPREVDDVFLDHPEVAQAVTFSLSHQTLGEDVVTAVVLRLGAKATSKDLREFALSRLAAYKVPSQVILVDQIPKGPTGKLQRIGLADRLSDSLLPEFEPIQTKVQQVLEGIWSEILTRSGFGLKDNFFACGGDSLLATRLVARIQASFDIVLPLGSVFRNPTIQEQADLIENMLLDEIESTVD